MRIRWFKNASRSNFWPIATSSTSKCHWSFLQQSRFTNLIEWCNSLRVHNVFCRHPRSSMTCTSTYGGDSRKIDQHSIRSILRFDNVGTITCQRVNHFSHRSWRHLQITWISLGITTSYIYCRHKKEVGSVVLGDQDEGPSILGRENMLQEDQHLLQLHTMI